MSSLILGLNAFHGDSAAALIEDGIFRCGVEEERLNRIKHWAGFPRLAIQAVLADSGATLADVEHVAISRDPGAHLLSKVMFSLRKRPGLDAIRSRLANHRRVQDVAELLNLTPVPSPTSPRLGSLATPLRIYGEGTGERLDAEGGQVRGDQASAPPLTRASLALSRRERGNESPPLHLERGSGGEVFSGTVHNVEHHRAHLASAFFCSPFDQAACLTVDGFGDFLSSMSAVGKGNRLEKIDDVMFPHSLGIFYTAVTQFLGFPKYGDEYKVMGLASYGTPSFLPQMRRIVRLEKEGQFTVDLAYFVHASEGATMSWENGEPVIGPLWSKELTGLLGPAREPGSELTERHHDLAASLQAMYEEAFFHRVNWLQKKTGLKALCLAGGCAMNSVANGKLFGKTDFRDVYIQSAAGDAGTALGAALSVWHEVLGKPRGFVMEHSYFGPDFGDAEIREALGVRSEEELRNCEIAELRDFQEPGLPSPPGEGGPRRSLGEGGWVRSEKGVPEARVRSEESGDTSRVHERSDSRAKRLTPGFRVRRIDDVDELCRETAEKIAGGKIVGWYQGRSEWGPRALGNRSIVVDPRRAEMKDVLNSRIKRREPFRPFAPSILEERVGDYFEESYPDPFMIKVYPIRPEKRSVIPAVTHVDGTGRLQTVSRTQNPRYWALIKAFETLTGVPVVLNTSFNENEPIVNTPAEALACFLRTKMDVLVMGNWVVEREE